MPPTVGTFSNFVDSVNPTPSPIDNNFTVEEGASLLVLATFKAVTTTANPGVDLTTSLQFDSVEVSRIDTLLEIVAGGSPTCRAFFLQNPTVGEHVLRLEASATVEFPLECISLTAINIFDTDGPSGLFAGNRSVNNGSSGGNNFVTSENNCLVIGIAAAQGQDTAPFVEEVGYTLLTTSTTGGSNVNDVGFGVQHKIVPTIVNNTFTMSWASSDGWGTVFVELLPVPTPEGTGILIQPEQTIFGTGEIAPLITGTGLLIQEIPSISGVGEIAPLGIGSGILIIQSPEILGIGFIELEGIGEINDLSVVFNQDLISASFETDELTVESQKDG